MKNLLSELDQLYEQGRMSEIESYLTAQIEGMEKENNIAGLVTLWSELGGYLRGCGRLEDSKAAFEHALEYQQQAAPEDKVARATLLINLGGTYRLWKRFEETMQLYDEAEQLLDGSYQYASLLNNKSLLCQELGRWDEAESLLYKALSIVKETPGCEEEVATAYTNLALLAGRQGQVQKEQELLQFALESYEERGAKEHPHYAAALSALGGSLYRSGDLSGACEAFEASAQLMYRLFGANREYEVIQKNLKFIREQLSGQ